MWLYLNNLNWQGKMWTCLKNTVKTDFEALKHMSKDRKYFKDTLQDYKKMLFGCFPITKADLMVSEGRFVFFLLITLEMFVELFIKTSLFFLEMFLF